MSASFGDGFLVTTAFLENGEREIASRLADTERTKTRALEAALGAPDSGVRARAMARVLTQLIGELDSMRLR